MNKPEAVRLISFGYRHGAVPQGATVIDVRRLFKRNPFHNKALRVLTGLDPEVQADIALTPFFEANYHELIRQVLQAPTEVVALGCTGGRHRSVYLAERLAQDLHLSVEHRDIAIRDLANQSESTQ